MCFLLTQTFHYMIRNIFLSQLNTTTLIFLKRIFIKQIIERLSIYFYLIVVTLTEIPHHNFDKHNQLSSHHCKQELKNHHTYIGYNPFHSLPFCKFLGFSIIANTDFSTNIHNSPEYIGVFLWFTDLHDHIVKSVMYNCLAGG